MDQESLGLVGFLLICTKMKNGNYIIGLQSLNYLKNIIPDYMIIGTIKSF